MRCRLRTPSRYTTGTLAIVFFVVPLIPLLRGPTLDDLVDRQAWAWLYGVDIYIAKQGDWSFSYLNHFWFLAIEEHFYLFWPLVALVLYIARALIVRKSQTRAACAVGPLSRIAHGPEPGGAPCRS